MTAPITAARVTCDDRWFYRVVLDPDAAEILDRRDVYLVGSGAHLEAHALAAEIQGELDDSFAARR